MQAVKHGKKVAVVERFERIGGGCTHWGTIPSKALRYAIFQMTEANSNPLFRAAGRVAALSLSRTAPLGPQRHRAAGRNAARVLRAQSRAGHRRACPVRRSAHGRSRRDRTEARQRFTADAFVIATGSRPYRPPDVDFSHPRIFDSDTILDLGFTPQSITIYGAGVVGCEYTSMFRNLECKVNLVNTRGQAAGVSRRRDHRRPGLPHARSRRAAPSRRDIRAGRGARRRRRPAPQKRQAAQDRHPAVGQRPHRQYRRTWASSRSASSPTSRGQIKVNENFQTAVPHIYAVGDVIGFPSLASAAYVQGRFAADAHHDRPGRPRDGPRYSHRHLHQPGDQLGRADRARADGRQRALRNRPCAVQAAWPGRRSPARRSAC